MKKKKEIIGEISVHSLITKIRSNFHRPTRSQSNKKIEKRQSNKIRRNLEDYVKHISYYVFHLLFKVKLAKIKFLR